MSSRVVKPGMFRKTEIIKPDNSTVVITIAPSNKNKFRPETFSPSF